MESLVSFHDSRIVGSRFPGGTPGSAAGAGAKKGEQRQVLPAITVAEVHRWFLTQSETPGQRSLRMRWSLFRRQQQARASQAHRLRRMRQSPLLPSGVPRPLMLNGLPELTAQRWEHLRPFLPPQGGTGRPALEHRLIVEGILWIISTGSSWRDLPARFGPWQTVSSRYQRWKKDGRWALLLQAFQQPELLSSA